MKAKPGQTQPFVNSEYMLEPGTTSPLIPGFLRPKQLGPAMREQGVPETPNVDQVDNRQQGNSVTPVGATGKDGVLLRPAGLLDRPRLPWEPRRLPPISLPEQNAVPSNLEAVGRPESYEAVALQKAMQQGSGRKLPASLTQSTARGK
jgi:hypothetical protein